MEWLNVTSVKPEDFCLLNFCFDRAETCPVNNTCGIKYCINKTCFLFDVGPQKGSVL